MTTISFDENIKLNKKHFKNLEDFQMYLVQVFQKTELSDDHKYILDERIADLKENPSDYISLDDLKSSIKRK